MMLAGKSLALDYPDIPLKMRKNEILRRIHRVGDAEKSSHMG